MNLKIELIKNKKEKKLFLLQLYNTYRLIRKLRIVQIYNANMNRQTIEKKSFGFCCSSF
jgi:hypothetical protein